MIYFMAAQSIIIFCGFAWIYLDYNIENIKRQGQICKLRNEFLQDSIDIRETLQIIFQGLDHVAYKSELSKVRLVLIEMLMDGDPKVDTRRAEMLMELAKVQEAYEKAMYPDLGKTV